MGSLLLNIFAFTHKKKKKDVDGMTCIKFVANKFEMVVNMHVKRNFIFCLRQAKRFNGVKKEMYFK